MLQVPTKNAHGKNSNKKNPKFLFSMILKNFRLWNLFSRPLIREKEKDSCKTNQIPGMMDSVAMVKKKTKKKVTNKRSEQFGFDPNQSQIRVRIPFLNVAEANWTQPSPSPSPSWSCPIIKGLLCNIYGANSVRMEGGWVHLQSEFLNLIAYISDSELLLQNEKKMPYSTLIKYHSFLECGYIDKILSQLSVSFARRIEQQGSLILTNIKSCT